MCVYVFFVAIVHVCATVIIQFGTLFADELLFIKSNKRKIAFKTIKSQSQAVQCTLYRVIANSALASRLLSRQSVRSLDAKLWNENVISDVGMWWEIQYCCCCCCLLYSSFCVSDCYGYVYINIVSIWANEPRGYLFIYRHTYTHNTLRYKLNNKRSITLTLYLMFQVECYLYMQAKNVLALFFLLLWSSLFQCFSLIQRYVCCCFISQLLVLLALMLVFFF